MSRLELPDGAWAELASPRKVPERKRRRYIAAMTALTSNPDLAAGGDPAEMASKIGPAEMELADAVSDMLILALVREWSYGDVGLDVLQDLPADAFDVLFLRCRDLAKDLTPDYSPDPDPKVPTNGYSPAPTGSSKAAQTSVTLSSATTS